MKVKSSWHPDAFQGTDEFFGAAVALVVFQPMFADGLELALEPATDDVHRDTAIGQLIDSRQLLGRQRRLPGAGQNRRNHLELGGRCQQGMAERHGFMLVLRAVAGGKANLRQAIFEAGLFGQLRQFAVVVDAPMGALLDFADHQPTTDVGHPIGKFHGLLTHLTIPRTQGCTQGLSSKRASQRQTPMPWVLRQTCGTQRR